MNIFLSFKHFSTTEHSINLFKNNLNFIISYFCWVRNKFNSSINIPKLVTNIHHTFNNHRIRRISLKIYINKIIHSHSNLNIGSKTINTSSNTFNSIFSFFIFSRSIKTKYSFYTITKSNGIKNNFGNFCKIFWIFRKNIIKFFFTHIISFSKKFKAINFIYKSICSTLIITSGSRINMTSMFIKTTSEISIYSSTFYITNKISSSFIIIFTSIIIYLSNNSSRYIIYIHPSTGGVADNIVTVYSIFSIIIN